MGSSYCLDAPMKNERPRFDDGASFYDIYCSSQVRQRPPLA